jgi:energy-coupling factor transport system ATP-binding protein
MDIIFKEVKYSYQKDEVLNLPFLDMSEDTIYGIVGHTGSGKSTLVQHLNGLIRPKQGEIKVLEYTFKHKTSQKTLAKVKKDVGLVFQFPENQLFKETIYEDILFAPKNFKLPPSSYTSLVEGAMECVGLPLEYLKESPFDLSGGEKRRVAIAGILAYDPKIIVFDEPTVGISYDGVQLIHSIIERKEKEGKKIIIVTHDMDFLLKVAKKVIVLNKGKITFTGTPLELFQEKQILEDNYLITPNCLKYALSLKEKGLNINLENVRDLDSLVDEITNNYE